MIQMMKANVLLAGSTLALLCLSCGPSPTSEQGPAITNASQSGRERFAEQWVIESADSFVDSLLMLNADGSFDLTLAMGEHNSMKRSAKGKWTTGSNSLVLQTGLGEEIRFETRGGSNVELLKYSPPDGGGADADTIASYIADLTMPDLKLIPKVVPDADKSITSNVNGGYAVCQPYVDALSPNYSKAYLIRKNGDDWEVATYLGVRYDPEKRDKVEVTKEAVAVLLHSASAQAYFHHLYARRSGSLVSFVIGPAPTGSDDVIVIGNKILGTIWLSPDNTNNPGNKLYVLNADGGQFIDLEGSMEGESLKLEKVSDSRFSLHRIVDGRIRSTVKQNFPIEESVTAITIK